MSLKAPFLIGIYGPTASGKTALAERLALNLGAQLINADAFQAYRYLDIGTAKPGNKERYKLVDILDPKEPFGVGDWVLRVCEELAPLYEKQQSAVVVGGTGLYLRALFEEYAEMGPPPDPELRDRLMARQEAEGLQALAEELRQKDPRRAERTDLNNPSRVRRALEKVIMGVEQIELQVPAFTKVKIAIDPDKSDLDIVIAHRAEQMLQNGWVDEVKGLLDRGYGPSDPAFRAIGYTDVVQYITNGISLEETAARVSILTRQYAKRQKTWLRSEPRLNRIVGFGYDSAVFAKATECII